MSARRRSARHLGRALAIVVAAAVLAGCAVNEDLADEYAESGYQSADGAVITFPADERGEPVTYAGTTDDGEEISSASLEGSVVVMNFWYAACPPCRLEAPDLVDLHAEYGDDVVFVGVNTRDAPGAAQSFEAEFGVEYPSIMDAEDRAVLAAFAEQVGPNAIPTTLIFDAEGRIAARFSGRIISATTFAEVLDDVLAESQS